VEQEPSRAGWHCPAVGTSSLPAAGAEGEQQEAAKKQARSSWRGAGYCRADRLGESWWEQFPRWPVPTSGCKSQVGPFQKAQAPRLHAPVQRKPTFGELAEKRGGGASTNSTGKTCCFLWLTLPLA